MPIYNYRCNQCHAHFSRIMKLSEFNDAVPCEKCNSGDVSKVITAPNNYTIKGDNSASTRPNFSRRRLS